MTVVGTFQVGMSKKRDLQTELGGRIKKPMSLPFQGLRDALMEP